MGVLWTRPTVRVSLYFSRKLAGNITYPEISRSGIKIEIECLCWCTNLNWAEILRVVLLVLRSDLASLSISLSSTVLPLHKNTVSLRLAANLMKETMVASLGHLVLLEVWTRLGRLEAPFLKEVDIGFGPGSFVGFVRDDFDLVQSFENSHDGYC